MTKEPHKIRTLAPILANYNYSPVDCQVVPIGNGLINQTYKVTSKKRSFILQRINRHVFSNPKQVIENADKLNQFLAEMKDSDKYDLSLVPQLKTIAGKSFVTHRPADSSESEFWRGLTLIDNTITIESIDNKYQAEQAAGAFAHFSRTLVGFDANKLHSVIPNFHNLNFRLQQLKDAVARNPFGRVNQVNELIKYCEEQIEFVIEVSKLIQRLPVRVTHNDTKISNLLFDSDSLNPIAVIDLDTCMPGFLMNDFGDMVRTCCSNLSEDSSELSQMIVRFDIFEGLVNGYVETFGDEMTKVERKSLVVGAQLLSFINGVRFLTDYINGDIYFGTSYAKQNWNRAANQLSLFHLLKENRQRLELITSHKL